MPLQAAMQRGTGQMGDRCLQSVEAIIEGQQSRMIASCSTVRTVERGCFGPVRRSATEQRFLHFATVFGLMPCRRVRVLRLS
jgi:hypothetical protein